MKNLIIINGKGGVGKDTLITFFENNTSYKVLNISSIDPYKSVAKDLGWDGQKDSKSRKFLSDLKRLSIEYNNFPTQYILNKVKDCRDNTIIFTHIREPEEIGKLIDAFKAEHINIGNKVCSVLIRRDIISNTVIGNTSDDNVDMFNYDFIYDNNSSLDISGEKFIDFIEKNIIMAGELYDE